MNAALTTEVSDIRRNRQRIAGCRRAGSGAWNHRIIAVVTIVLSHGLLDTLPCSALSTGLFHRIRSGISSMRLRPKKGFGSLQFALSFSKNAPDTDFLSNNEMEFTSIDASMFRYHQLNDIERVYCLSDLHTDHPDNIKWLRDQALSPSRLKKTDLLIVAGDISHDEDTFLKSISILLDQCKVLFVPGNHEAWLSNQLASGRNHSRITETSLEKLQRCYDTCRSIGVLIDPVYLSGGPHPVWILPLQSWYDGSLSFDEELCQGFEVWPWVDFARCKWNTTAFPPMKSPNARIPRGLVEYFLEHNRMHTLEPWNAFLQSHPEFQAPSITVSHFAPNQQCLPDWKDLRATTFQTDAWLDHGAATMSAKFAKVAGTQWLDAQLRSSSSWPTPQLHIFGHSHRPKDFVYQSIRYIHNPLGKPRERQLHMISPQVSFQEIWNVRQGEIIGPTILRYWEDFGGGKEMLRQRMSNVLPGRYQQEGGDRGRGSII
jgi:Calcineurin-like phosphoesterase